MMGCFSKFLSNAIWFIFLSLLLIPASTLIQSNEEGYISAVISSEGLDFAKDLLINKAISSVIPVKLKDIEKTVAIILIGKVKTVLSNITIYSVDIDVDKSCVETGETGLMLAVSNATAKLSMNWEYSYGSWLVPTISDHGTASVLVEGLEVGLTVALEERGGAIELSLLDCGGHVKGVSIELNGGASWLYQPLVDAFSGKIRSAVEDVSTSKIRELIRKLDSKLQLLPKRISFTDVATINVTFVKSPVLGNSSIELEINGLFTETSGTSVLNYYYEGSEASIFCNGPAKMVGVTLNENVISSAALVYFNANHMHWILDESPDQSLLNTFGWIFIVPDLYLQYPDNDMNLNMTVISPPIIRVSEHGIDATISLDVTINVMASSEVVPVACISMVLIASCSPEISRNNLGGIIRLVDFTASLKWSIIGNINMHLLQTLLSTILKTAFIPYLNLHFSQGFPLPLPHDFSLENAEIFCIDSSVMICTDLALTK